MYEMKEEEAASSSLEGGGSSSGGDGGEADSGISEYEKQRLSRIRENKARLQALGLPHLASSLVGSQSKRRQSSENKAKRKRKKKTKMGDDDGDDDDEYRPSDEEDRGGNHEWSSEGEEDDSHRKGKKKCPSNAVKVKKCSYAKKEKESYQTDDDTALQQAIALSLGEITEDSTTLSDMGTSIHVKKEKANIQETARKRKNAKSKSRVQLTEDEVVAYFFSFDEAGKGHISLRDLERMVVAHDFNWTDTEIASMIHSFDSDRDGKLHLEDFRTIVSRCNMMQETEPC